MRRPAELRDGAGPWDPGLLVSVRSAGEAEAAVLGGAAVVDVKDPDRGPLGRASVEAWRAVREVVPRSIPVSVALGELVDRDDAGLATGRDLEGVAYRKLGLAGSGPGWRGDWAGALAAGPEGPRWVAVAYADWEAARAPDPVAVLEAALEAPDCSGVLVDTWDKATPSPLGPTEFWANWAAHARRSGRFVALAGGLDLAAIVRLAPLRPDLFAVRGASCDRSDRRGTVRLERVAELVRVVRSLR